MKVPLIFLLLDVVMVLGYGLALFANLLRRIFGRRSNPKM